MANDTIGDGAPPQAGNMTSSRPYLLRAVYDWINDNGLTPQIIVDTSLEGVVVPLEYAHENRIVLNISPTAVRNLNLGNDWVTFGARFGGRPMEVFVPTHAVLAVMARETGAGMPFPEEAAPAAGRTKQAPPGLDGDTRSGDDDMDQATVGPVLASVTDASLLGDTHTEGASSGNDFDSTAGTNASTHVDDGANSRPSGPPNLRVIK